MPPIPQQKPTVKHHREFQAAAAAAMIRLGWKQRHLAKAIGKSRTAISQCLNAGAFPGVRQAIKKALHLD